MNRIHSDRLRSLSLRVAATVVATLFAGVLLASSATAKPIKERCDLVKPLLDKADWLAGEVLGLTDLAGPWIIALAAILVLVAAFAVGKTILRVITLTVAVLLLIDAWPTIFAVFHHSHCS